MLFYTIIIITTVLLYYLVTKLEKGSIAYLFFFSLFLLFPSIIGGCRDLSIGTDIAVYGVQYWDYAYFSRSFSSLIEYSPTTEYGYILLNYLCSFVSKDIHFFLFVNEAIKLLLVGIVAVRFKKSMNSSMFIFAYMLFFFIGGFSMLRQQLALSICLFSLIFYFDKKWIPFFISILFAWSFHHSAFIMIFLPVLDMIGRRWYSLPIIIFILYIIYTFKTQLLILIAGTGLVKEVMADRYLDSGVTSAKTNILIAVSFLAYSIISQDKNIWRKRMIMANSIFCVFFLFMSTYFEVAFRVSFYQMIVLMALVLISIKEIRSSIFRNIYTVIYAMLFILYFIVEGTHGLSGTLPYKSGILGFS